MLKLFYKCKTWIWLKRKTSINNDILDLMYNLLFILSN